MPRTVVIADVHGNLPALEAVLSDCGSYDSLWFLGDAVDLGPWPRECVELVSRLSAEGVVGNHDEMVLKCELETATGVLSESPPRSAQATQFALWRSISYSALTEPNIRYLKGLPQKRSIDAFGMRVLLLHHPYPHGYFDDNSSAEDVAGAFEQPVDHDLVLFGHSHAPIERTFDSVRYICVPSVGQPRDCDPRAGYLVIEGGACSLVRVSYDIDRTVKAITELPLAEWFVEKWIRFVRTADASEWHAKK